MDTTSLGNRMKRYEAVSDPVLTPRTPLIIRLDGKGFSKFTRGLEKPMDDNLRLCMEYAAFELLNNIEGCRFAYTQSDEITLVLVDYSSRVTQPWFNYKLDKVLSISASMCTSAFIKAALRYLPEHLEKRGFPNFDSRAFNIPKEDVSNAILWRQQDATRNAILGLGQAYFSHKELQGKSCDEIQEMLFTEEGINFNDMPTYYKRGFSLYKINYTVGDPDGPQCVRKKIIVDLDMPIITKDRSYIDNWLQAEPNYDLKPQSSKAIKEIKLNAKDCYCKRELEEALDRR